MLPYIVIGSVTIRTYFLVMSVALFMPLWLCPKRTEKMMPGREKDVLDMLLVMFFSALVGFRMFHVIFELPGYYLAHPLDILKVWKGGFVAFGGLIVPMAVFVLWTRWKKMPVLLTADILAAPFALIFVIARIACFLNGCCFGKPTDAPWCVVFPQGGAAPAGICLHPTQLYLSFSALAVFLLILAFEKTRLNKYWFPGLSTAIFFVLYPVARFVVEFFRADFRGGQLFGLSVSQCLSIGLVAVGGLVLAAGLRNRDKKLEHSGV